MRGVVKGTEPGDSVEVWFKGGGKTSESFTYEAVSDTGNEVLVVAAEDYTGASPTQSAAARTTSTTTWTQSRPTDSGPMFTMSMQTTARRRITSAC